VAFLCREVFVERFVWYSKKNAFVLIGGLKK